MYIFVFLKYLDIKKNKYNKNKNCNIKILISYKNKLFNNYKNKSNNK